MNRSNFYVCNVCGYTHLSNKGFQMIYPKRHRKFSGYWCENENLQKYALGYRFDTDVIQIRFLWPQITIYEQALSILYGIMKGTCAYLNIEENDIAGCLRYFYNKATKTGSYTIVLYDKTPGGAGHVKRLNYPDVFEAVLKETRDIIGRCTCGGESMDATCYNCLKSYYNQKYHDVLQRRYVIEFLNDFFDDNLGKADTFENISSRSPLGLIDNHTSRENEDFESEFDILLTNYVTQISESQRFIGLMKDFLFAYPKQLNLLITLYRMDITKSIEEAAVLNDIFAYRFEKRMDEEMGISKDNAKWAVATWCFSYGVNILRKPCEIERVKEI